jgi:hypothetical protein
MTLPIVSGWVIDFRTARAIFSSGSNERISHCVDLCNAKRLFLCHCDEPQFKEVPALKAAFLDGAKCVVVPDDDILTRCVNIAETPVADKKLLVGNDAAIFITAIAASKNYGVISDPRSALYNTVFDIGNFFGLPVLSANEYFSDAL